MTTRYANSSGSNTSPYDTLAKGATDPQTIIDLAVAGDENRYTGTFVEGTHYTTQLDFDLNAGSIASGYIKHIGVNGSDVVDGTLAVFDGNSSGACVVATQPYHWFENIRCTQSTGYGFNFASGSADNEVVLNCMGDNNGSHGCFCGASATGAIFILCIFKDNTSVGLSIQGASGRVFYCSCIGNGSSGIDGSSGSIAIVFCGNLIHDNTLSGINDMDLLCIFINNVIDGEVVGLDIDDDACLLIGNRITNCTTGIDFNNQQANAGWNHFFNNTTDVLAAIHAYNIPYREALTNDLMSDGIDGTNTVDTGSDDGYNNRATDDFNLKSGAENRRIEVDLEVGS